MIRWHPFTLTWGLTRHEVMEAAKTYAIEGKYVLVSFVPGAGWRGSYGVQDGRQTREAVEVTDLITDRHVHVKAFSVPGSGDRPENGGPNRAA